MQRLGRRQKSLELVNRRYIKTLQNVWNTSIRLWPLAPGLSWTLINQNAISEAVLPPKKNTSTGFRYAVKKNKVGTSLSYFFSFSCFSNSCNSFCFCSCKNNFSSSEHPHNRPESRSGSQNFISVITSFQVKAVFTTSADTLMD